MRFLVFILAFQTCLGATAAQDMEERTTYSRRLVLHLGLVADFIRYANGMIEYRRTHEPNFPTAYWQKVLDTFSTEEFRKAVIDLYATNLSLEELQYLVGMMDRLPMKTLVPDLLANWKNPNPDPLWLQKKYGDEVVKLGVELIAHPAFKKMGEIDAQHRQLRGDMAVKALTDASDRINGRK